MITHHCDRAVMWLVRILWAGRGWALPFLTVLVPSARYHVEQGRRHETLTRWACQMLAYLHRWLPGRELVVVTEHVYAALHLLAACQRWSITAVVRLCLDAALDTAHRALVRRPPLFPGVCSGHGPLVPLRPARHVFSLRWVLLRNSDGVRAPMALLCTDPQRDPDTIVIWFLRRWQVEVAF